MVLGMICTLLHVLFIESGPIRVLDLLCVVSLYSIYLNLNWKTLPFQFTPGTTITALKLADKIIQE